MPLASESSRGPAAPAEPSLARTYVLVLIVEAVVITVLFWLGRAYA